MISQPNDLMLWSLKTISQFKNLGSPHIQKEIKLQKAMNGMDRVLRKADLILIRRHSDI